MDASLRQGKADNNSHPLRENYAISRDDTSGNNREIEDLSAITPQTQRGDVVVVNLQVSTAALSLKDGKCVI
jgi:hypothetical protein